jgi:cytochrome d ubiquinol oxidase subunit II
VNPFFASLGEPEIVAGIIVLALNAYVLLGGADFGGGVWDLLAGGARRAEQRELIAQSIAPIWEANHVWLIVVVVMLFTAFPVAFGALGIVLHLPIALMLLGVVLRGSAFIFRSYGSRAEAHRRRWGAAFAAASVITPILLGDIIGALATGEVGRAYARAGSGSFVETYVAPWLAVFPICVGLFALALFAFLAAVYLTVASRDAALREDFRVRALAAAVVVFAAAAASLFTASYAAPRIAGGVMTAPWAIALHVATGAAAIGAIAALWTRRYRAARVAAAAQTSLILWGWASSQYPFLIPDTLTIRQAAAPHVTLSLLLAGLAGGALILIPSLRYLFRTFSTSSSTP